MDDYIVASLSGGKDSTCMILKSIECGKHIDEVICCDTGMEFDEMMDHVEKLKKVVENAGIKFTSLKSDKSFDYYFSEHTIKKRDGSRQTGGYGWPRMGSRWCTTLLKINVIKKYFNQLKKKYNIIECIGYAVDEPNADRQKKIKAYQAGEGEPNHIYPLIDWNMTEGEALQYCYDNGYDWGGLYEIYDRVSCWCCPLSSAKEIRLLKVHHPEKFKKLTEMDEKVFNTIKNGYSLEDIILGDELKNQVTWEEI